MSKTQRFFRYLWRVNAIVIFLAAALITLGVGAMVMPDIWRSIRAGDNERGIVVPPTASGDRLILGRSSLLPGTEFMRAELTTNGGGDRFGSSGGYSEIRNILFIDPSQTSAHWLLPDNMHVISDLSDISEEENGRRPKRLLATAVLVKPRSASNEASLGRVLLFDPSGKNTIEVASNVNDIQLSGISGNVLRILYERNRRLVLATFSSESLAKRTEQEIEVPELKQ